ncbi:MAG: DUF3800 domain-containing protein [Glycocaulis sp.]
MTHSFHAFIDESGDDGLSNFREPYRGGGSSKWLVIGAMVIRARHDLETVSWRDQINELLPDRRKRVLHFADLKHNQRIVAATKVAGMPVKFINVVACKPVIPNGTYRDKNQLYFYMTRYLIERISWFCRDVRRSVPEGDGRVAITFSRRGGMQYDAFREYLRRLRGTDDQTVRIHWPVVDIDAVDAKDHGKLAALQLADIGPSAIAAGFEPDHYGNVERRYSEILRPVVYNRHGNYLSYGLKVVPDYQRCALNPEQMRTIDLWK